MTASAEVWPLRRLIYPLFITLAAGAVAGRILSVARVYEPILSRPDDQAAARFAGPIAAPFAAGDPLAAAALAAAGETTWRKIDAEEQRGVWPPTRPEPMPTHGDNDRSRWDTVRALVDDGTYAIGSRETLPGNKYTDRGIITQDGWKTIDKVMDPEEHDGRHAFYSSKPPFLPTLVAGEYWLLKHGLGWSITDRPWSVVRTILLTINWLPLVIYLVLLARLVERYGTTDWGRLYVLAAGCLGTFMTPFSITFNNHTIAGWSTLFALYAVLRIWDSARPAAPGREELGARGLWARVKAMRGSATASPGWFIMAGFFATFTACNEMPAASLAVAVLVVALWLAPWRALLYAVPAAALPLAFFFATNHLAVGFWEPVDTKFGSDWYTYKDSYWNPPEPGRVKRGIDWAREPKTVYAFNVLLGHHGFFSLTPVFLLAAAGMLGALGRRRRTAPSQAPAGPAPPPSALGGVVVLTVLITVIVVAFYVYKTNNYGGWTSAPRWLIWLIPLWLLSLLPAADWAATRRWGRGLAYVLLALSVLSVNYAPWTPWRHPWLYDLMQSFGWFRY
jgi:hypothetical protein